MRGGCIVKEPRGVWVWVSLKGLGVQGEASRHVAKGADQVTNSSRQMPRGREAERGRKGRELIPALVWKGRGAGVYR